VCVRACVYAYAQDILCDSMTWSQVWGEAACDRNQIADINWFVYTGIVFYWGYNLSGMNFLSKRNDVGFSCRCKWIGASEGEVVGRPPATSCMSSRLACICASAVLWAIMESLDAIHNTKNVNTSPRMYKDVYYIHQTRPYLYTCVSCNCVAYIIGLSYKYTQIHNLGTIIIYV